ncbi:MAG: hypothetical protein HQ506_02670 [Candidatus Marinimicrobia bacterium]|nr:hypothetical protein [Candidatus Neomarinimicrobiota bacterium]
MKILEENLGGHLPGYYFYNWSGTDESTHSIKSGVYLVKVQTKSEFKVLKVISLK